MTLPFRGLGHPRRALRAQLLAGACLVWSGVCGLVLAAPDAPAPGPWPEALYNPRSAPDDLILPLPCGGAMAFRAVATPAASARTRLVGPFGGGTDGAGERHLLVGKYEVTALQYQTVMAQGAGLACPPVAPAAPAGRGTDGRLLAQAGVSRIDAVNFAAQLSRWLQANAARLPPCTGVERPCLPRVEGRPAFVRLPLDAEWDYAARGGALVTDAEFALARYPMPEGLERHAWFNRNSDGELAQIGLRLPNPLGLHDLYGNAWELMNDPYSSEAFPGQVGGDALRGGGIHSAEEDLRADARIEVQPYDSAGDVKTADTGFRVVLAAPVVTTAARRPAVAAPDGGTTVARPAPTAGLPVPSPSPPPADGRLRIEVDQAAIVLVDGEVQGAAVAGRALEVKGLARGTHQVEARAAGGRSAQTSLEIGSAVPALVRLHLDPTPEQVELALALGSAERLRVRKQLDDLGYPAGPVSDRFDASFRRVLRRFQEDEGLPVTGFLNLETRSRLALRVVQRGQPERPLQPPRPMPNQPPNQPPPRPGGSVLEFPDAGPGGGWMDPAPPGY